MTAQSTCVINIDGCFTMVQGIAVILERRLQTQHRFAGNTMERSVLPRVGQMCGSVLMTRIG